MANARVLYVPCLQEADGKSTAAARLLVVEFPRLPKANREAMAKQAMEPEHVVNSAVLITNKFAAAPLSCVAGRHDASRHKIEVAP